MNKMIGTSTNPEIVADVIADAIVEGFDAPFSKRELGKAFKIARELLEKRGMVKGQVEIPDDLKFGDDVTVTARRDGASGLFTGKLIKAIPEKKRVQVITEDGKLVTGKFVSRSNADDEEGGE